VLRLLEGKLQDQFAPGLHRAVPRQGLVMPHHAEAQADIAAGGTPDRLAFHGPLQRKITHLDDAADISFFSAHRL